MLMLLSSVLIFVGIMSVFTFLATFFIYHWISSSASNDDFYVTRFGGLFGQPCTRQPRFNQLNALLKRLRLVLAGSQAVITLLGNQHDSNPFFRKAILAGDVPTKYIAAAAT